MFTNLELKIGFPDLTQSDGFIMLRKYGEAMTEAEDMRVNRGFGDVLITFLSYVSRHDLPLSDFHRDLILGHSVGRTHFELVTTDLFNWFNECMKINSNLQPLLLGAKPNAKWAFEWGQVSRNQMKLCDITTNLDKSKGQSGNLPLPLAMAVQLLKGVCLTVHGQQLLSEFLTVRDFEMKQYKYTERVENVFSGQDWIWSYFMFPVHAVTQMRYAPKLLAEEYMITEIRTESAPVLKKLLPSGIFTGAKPNLFPELNENSDLKQSSIQSYGLNLRRRMIALCYYVLATDILEEFKKYGFNPDLKVFFESKEVLLMNKSLNIAMVL